MSVINRRHQQQQSRRTYTLNRPKATKLALQITLVSIVAQASDNQSLERIAAN